MIKAWFAIAGIFVFLYFLVTSPLVALATLGAVLGIALVGLAVGIALVFIEGPWDRSDFA